MGCLENIRARLAHVHPLLIVNLGGGCLKISGVSPDLSENLFLQARGFRKEFEAREKVL